MKLTPDQRIIKIFFSIYYLSWIISGSLILLIFYALIPFIILSIYPVIYWIKTGESLWKRLEEIYGELL